MTERVRTTYIEVTVAARQAGLSPRTVRRYIRRGLVDTRLDEGDLIELRRIRRLTDLGVNLAGVEIILRMRRRIEDLQAETARLRGLLEAISRDGTA
jgi:MerR family transcriptional regulator/heat shock protein HspR